MKNSNNNNSSYLGFKYFSYLAVTILSMSVIIGLFLIIQHLTEEDNANKFIANQETLLENQAFLKNITTFLHDHEVEEIKELKKRTDISMNNSHKLDQIIGLLSGNSSSNDSSIRNSSTS